MTQPHTTAEAMETAALAAAEADAEGVTHPAPPRARKPGSPAEWAYQRVIAYLKAFEEGLTPGQEAAMGFTGGAGGLLRIKGIGFHAPDLVTFHGIDQTGARAQLIQHVSQLNVLLRAVPRPEDRPEPERIGFRLARALEDEAEAVSRDGTGAAT